MSFLFPAANAQAAAGSPPGGEWIQIAMFVGIFVLFYFIAIRPQRKRQKEHTDMVGALAVGDEVATTSGILGKVRKLDDSYVVLKVSDNVELKFQKVAIHAVLPKGTLKSIDA
jgi:preprotein translocase subunit YajC